MKITILTLFPQMFSGPFDYSIIKKAIDKKLVEIEFVDIRDFGLGKHKIVDDKPYGGGHGMILRVDVIKNAIDSVRQKGLKKDEEKVILTSASGLTYTQAKAKEYSNLKHLIIICGHYEGIDARIRKYIDEEISIGGYVLTGGEIPAMVITDSISRLVSGVLKEGVTENESFSNQDALEHDQFTRPDEFDEVEVPSILLSGNHKKIDDWKKIEGEKKTTAQKASQSDQ